MFPYSKISKIIFIITITVILHNNYSYYYTLIISPNLTICFEFLELFVYKLKKK